MPTRKCLVASVTFLLVFLSWTTHATELTGRIPEAGILRELAERCSRFDAKLPTPEMFGVKQIIAYEEHRHFVYAMGELVCGEQGALGKRIVIFLKPDTFLFADKLGDAAWEIVARHVGDGVPLACDLSTKDGTLELTFSGDDRVGRLTLTNDIAAGTIALQKSGKTLLARRPLPAGIMPHGPAGVAMIEGWDAAYRGQRAAPWDSGRPNTTLVEAVENGTLKPCRTVVLGAGSGTNAIYLAERGFTVTAIDVAPTAVAIARRKAAEANVNVRWLLADVLEPPLLEPFEFLFDSGCYHGVRRANPSGYVKTVDALAKSGALMLIHAGNANEPRHYGPPRVEEADLVGDFSKTWDFVQLREIRPEGSAWFWSVLLRRK